MAQQRRGRPVTAWDVARAAGVNQSAVSRAFDPEAPVAPATRERLLRIAAELGYHPNAIARGLITGRTRLVGVTVADFSAALYPELLETLARGLRQRNYHTLLLPLPPDRTVAEEIDQLLSYAADGLVIISGDITAELAARVARSGTALVLVNRELPGTAVAAVRTDDAAGGRAAAEALIAAGGTRFAFVAGRAEALTSCDRGMGFAARLAEAGFPAPPVWVGDFRYDKAAALAARMLAAPERPDAVFCANDAMALAVIDVARRDFGLAIPGHVAVVGFDDTPAAALDAYRLATIRPDLPAMAESVIAALEAQLNESGKSLPRPPIPGRMILRHSAAPGLMTTRTDGAASLPAPASPD